MTFATRKVVRGQIDKHNLAKIRSLRRNSKEEFLLKLSSLNWHNILECTDVNKACNLFKEYFHLVLDKVAPIKEQRDGALKK